MPLDFESRELLSDIYQIKPKKRVAITKLLHSNSSFDMLHHLEKEGVIEGLNTPVSVSNDPWATSDKGTLYDIIFTVNDWQKLDEFGINEFNNLITEPYGKDNSIRWPVRLDGFTSASLRRATPPPRARHR